jgi:hypothetical protein
VRASAEKTTAPSNDTSSRVVATKSTAMTHAAVREAGNLMLVRGGARVAGLVIVDILKLEGFGEKVRHGPGHGTKIKQHSRRGVMGRENWPCLAPFSWQTIPCLMTGGASSCRKGDA